MKNGQKSIRLNPFNPRHQSEFQSDTIAKAAKYFKQIKSYFATLHFVTMPSKQTRFPKNLEVKLLGVTCLFPKLPSKPTKNSIFPFAYSVSIEAINCFSAFSKAICSSKEFSSKLKFDFC